MGASGSSGQDAVANAEMSAAILTTRAGAQDPSAIPSICRVSAALQYPAGECLTLDMKFKWHVLTSSIYMRSWVKYYSLYYFCQNDSSLSLVDLVFFFHKLVL